VGGDAAVAPDADAFAGGATFVGATSDDVTGVGATIGGGALVAPSGLVAATGAQPIASEATSDGQVAPRTILTAPSLHRRDRARPT